MRIRDLDNCIAKYKTDRILQKHKCGVEKPKLNLDISHFLKMSLLGPVFLVYNQLNIQFMNATVVCHIDDVLITSLTVRQGSLLSSAQII